MMEESRETYSLSIMSKREEKIDRLHAFWKGGLLTGDIK